MKRTVKKLTTLTMFLAVAICIFLFTVPAYAIESVPESFDLGKIDGENDVTPGKNNASEPLSQYNAFIDDYKSFEVTSTNYVEYRSPM